MKAIVYAAPGQFAYREVPTPRPAAGQILIRVHACGLCRTDMHIHEGHFIASFPLINGHEFTGEVLELGEGAQEFAIGDRVVADNSYPCGQCRFCRLGKLLYCENFGSQGCNRAGGFAEYVAVSADHAYKIHNLSYREAVMTEPTACAIHGMDVIDLDAGSQVLLFGAGPTGILLAQLLKQNGAAHLVVAAPPGAKLELVKELAADRIIAIDRHDYGKHREMILEAYPGGFDAVIDATGVPALFASAFDYVKMGGQVVAYGVYPEQAQISVSPYDLFARELTVKGSFAQTHEFPRALAYLESGQALVSDLVTHEVPLAEYGRALDLMRTRQAIKIAIIP